MFCRYCGKEMKDTAIVCSACGRQVEGKAGLREGQEARWGFTAMLALIGMTIFVPPIGLVVGLLGRRQEARRAQSAVLLTISVIMSLLLAAIMLGL